MHGSAVFAEEHDFQIDPRDTRCIEEKRGKSGTLWKKKNRERGDENENGRLKRNREREEREE